MADENRKFESSTFSSKELKLRPKPADQRKPCEAVQFEPEQFSRQLINRLIDRLKGS